MYFVFQGELSSKCQAKEEAGKIQWADATRVTTHHDGVP